MFKFKRQLIVENMWFDYGGFKFTDGNALPRGLLEELLPADTFIIKFAGKFLGEFLTTPLASPGNTDYLHMTRFILSGLKIFGKSFIAENNSRK